MELINNNPYRIIGILSNTSARDLEKQKGKIRAFARVGKEIKSVYDFQILSTLVRTEDSINKAFSNIEQNQDKISHALFWFLNVSPFDITAIEYLKNGNEEKSLDIWQKVTQNKEVNSKNFSAFNNLGTHKLLSQSQSVIKEGIEVKIQLIELDYFEIFVHSVADETFTINKEKQIEKLVDELLTQFKNKYSSAETLRLFSSCNDSIQKYLSKKFTEEPIHKIESQIESCKKKHQVDKRNAYEFGIRLFTNTKEDLLLLESLLGKSDPKYKAVADQLANEIIQCGIDYFNESQDNNSHEDYLVQAQELNKTALTIAVGQLTKDRAKDSLETLDEMKDQEMKQAVELLRSVKEAYETNETQIRQEVKRLKETDFDIRLGRSSINQSAVDDSIMNSIDWMKVNLMLIEVLPEERLHKIKSSSNIELKAEFIELAYWLKKYSQNKLFIDYIIEKYRKIPPNLSFKIWSSKITNTDNKPLYTKFIRHIGLSLNIEVTKETSVVFYLKYINPDGTINRNWRISPNNYSLSSTKKLKTKSNTIRLSSWGNDDDCTYMIGEHRIEVYVDEYLIHTNEFTVELAPSDKLKKEIASANERLKEINRKDYYESEIKTAQNKMNEIEEFKFLRASSNRKSQIEEQQKVIDQLNKSLKENQMDLKVEEKRIQKLTTELATTKY